MSLVTEGTQIILYQSVDNVLNQETAQNATFKVDRTPPTVNITGASDGTFLYTFDELSGGVFTNANSFSVSYVANDTVSGIYRVRLDSTVANTTSGTLSIPLPPGISTHTLTAEDMAGNPSSSINFSVVSVPPGTFTGGVAPQGGGLWKNAVKTDKYTSAEIATLLQQADLASRAFGVPLNRYNDATLSNYIDYIELAPSQTPDDKVRRELLTTWLNFVSGREPAAQAVNVNIVPGWSSVVKNTGGNSNTTALNLIREAEHRLAESPSATLLVTIKDLLERLNDGKLNIKA